MEKLGKTMYMISSIEHSLLLEWGVINASELKEEIRINYQFYLTSCLLELRHRHPADKAIRKLYYCLFDETNKLTVNALKQVRNVIKVLEKEM